MRHVRFSIRLLLVVTLLFLSGSSPGFSQTKSTLLNKMKELTSQGVIRLNNVQGKNLINYNGTRKLVPASIIKIATALAAFEILGEDFRFQTEFYLNRKKELLIRGLGDPFLISEEIQLIADQIRSKGTKKITRIFVDNSAFAPNIAIPGLSDTLNPYDALNGALIVNFNTLFLRRDRQGRVFSAEELTPLTPLAQRRGEVLKKGKTDRIPLARENNESLQYAAELFTAIFQQAGIEVTSNVPGFEKAGPGWDLYYTHHNTRTLEEIVKGMLEFSNNYIANQIYLTIGAKKRGYSINMDQANQVVRNFFYNHLKISSEDFFIDEGSGISRNNRITGDVMISLLEQFKQYAHLLPEKKGALVKSGTLTGVYNYAGFLKSRRVFFLL